MIARTHAPVSKVFHGLSLIVADAFEIYHGINHRARAHKSIILINLNVAKWNHFF